MTSQRITDDMPQWYKFARKRHVYDIDDFPQIHDDLRPFWGLDPKEVRDFAAHASVDFNHQLSTISIRDGQIFQKLWDSWRGETFVSMLRNFVQYLPDMDIPMNRMDQPRVVVPWERMQELLAKEVETRPVTTDANDAFSLDKKGLRVPDSRPPWWQTWFSSADVWDPTSQTTATDWGWYAAQGRQFMDIARKACSPESYSNNPDRSPAESYAQYKHSQGGFITNFNLSSDLCTVGPQIQEAHGLLFASSSMFVTERLVPVFGECKTNVNNDILFPANMYYKRDRRYEYAPAMDASWDDKRDDVLWRGVTSGGAQREDNWKGQHRQRLVMLLNSTVMQGSSVSVLHEDAARPGHYNAQDQFQPSFFAAHHTDIGFTEKMSCIPNCDFYNDTFAMQPQTTFAEQFGHKYLVDVDGHSFSGRWRAFLLSRSLGIKATIFREWHDSRLFAWRHFVPMDNRYDDLYSLLTYFIGLNSNADTQTEGVDETNQDTKVTRHDYEAMKIAKQGQEWAQKVLRREDIEIYTYRLLLEYGRIIDDNRDRIGFAGDGGVEMEEFDRLYPAL